MLQEPQNAALVAFYKANPWLYLEEILIEKPHVQKLLSIGQMFSKELASSVEHTRPLW